MGILGVNGATESAPSREDSCHGGPFGFAGFHDVLQDPIHGVFVEYAQIAVGKDIEFKGFEFQTRFVRHIMKGDGAKIWQAGFGTNGGIFRDFNRDFIPGKLIWPSFDLGEWYIQSAFRMLGGVPGWCVT